MKTESSESRSDFLRVWGLATAVTVAGFVIAYQFVEPAPPRTVHLSAGALDGNYYRVARRYSIELARQGIELVIHESAGTVENLSRLTAPDSAFDLALVQGGVGGADRQPGLVALGSLYHEPLWVFHRRGLRIADLRDLRGRSVAVGAAGSGTRAVALRLLAENGVGPENAQLVALGATEASAQLQAGDLDVVMVVTAPQAAVVNTLLTAPDIALLDFARATAYERRMPFLSQVTLPRGAVSLAGDLPPSDITLIAPAATLVAREDLHPALADLLLQAATKVHGRGTLLDAPGQFPSPLYLDFPLAPEAERFYRSGPPFLQRYLPFWLATGVDRLKVLILPLLTVLLPLLRIVPPFYQWRVRHRIYKWYRDVRSIEIEGLADPSDDDARRAGLAELDRIEADLVALKVPLGISDSLYHLRTHIAFVRNELTTAGASGPQYETAGNG